MKFLCVECDEAMKLTETLGPDDGSMTVIFGCPQCGKRTAMLTNAMETQMVRSLDVKIGGRKVPAQPMEMVRSSLAYEKDRPPVASDRPENSGGNGDAAGADGSKCPFSSMVESAYSETKDQVRWTNEAEERLARIPDMVKPMVKKSIEQYAQEKGYTEIDVKVMEEVRGGLGF